MDVYNHFKFNNINELLRTNENEIIKYIETKYEKVQLLNQSYVVFINVIKF